MSKRQIVVLPFSFEATARAKTSFATRRVPSDAMSTLISGSVRPCSGDLILASVVRLGQHRHLEQPNGRRSKLHVGDQIVVAYADRYAADQYESEVPGSLGPTQLVASGGIASQVLSRSHAVRSATEIQPLGLLGDDRGRPLNVSDFALTPPPVPASRLPTLAVFGTSMNAGKTTTIRYLVHTLSRMSLRPGACKVTGTGSGNDYWVMLDAGAHLMLDFTDVGLASTYRQPVHLLETKLRELIDLLSASGTGINLVEVADGIFQQETAQLIDSDIFRASVDKVIFAASDAMGAALGVAHLRERGYDVVAVSGVLTRSPLAMREAASATGLPVLGIAELSDFDIVSERLGLEVPVSVPVPGQTAALASPALDGQELAAESEALAGIPESFMSSRDLSSLVVPEQR